MEGALRDVHAHPGIVKAMQQMLNLAIAQRALGGWPAELVTEMLTCVDRLRVAVHEASGTPLTEADKRAVTLERQLWSTTERVEGVAKSLRKAVEGARSAAAAISEKQGKGEDGGEEGPYDLELVNPAGPTPPWKEDIEALRMANLELRAERDELEAESQMMFEELQQLKRDKELLEHEVENINASLLDRLERLREEEECMREAMAADAQSEESTRLQKRIALLEDELLDTRKALEAATRMCEESIDRAITRRVGKLELSLADMQTRPSVAEPEAKLAYRYQHRNRLESVYMASYEGNGMGMVWGALQSVLFLEYGMERIDTFCRKVNEYIIPYINPEVLRRKLADRGGCRELYAQECAKLRCKPNSEVLRILPHSPPLPHADATLATDLTELNLSNNLLGDKGLQALLPVIQRLRRLHTLNLSNNGLQNKAVFTLVEELKVHPSVTSIDLSGNRISRSAGKELLQLAICNHRIREVKLEGTRVDMGLQERLRQRIADNLAAGGAAVGRHAPLP